MPRTATSTVDAKIVGASLREARTQQGLTQADLADRLNVSAAYVQKIEAGRSNPTVGQLANVARALDRRLIVEFTQRPASVDPLAEYAAL